MAAASTVDHSAIKTGQVLAITVLTFAYLFDRWELVAAQAAIFFMTTLDSRIGPFTLVYRWLLLPLGIVKPDVRVDHWQPHRFGQAVGALSAAAAALLLYAGLEVAGWLLVAILIALTAVSYMGWCIGCFIYYQLNRFGLKGFFSKEPTDRDVVLGARPRRPGE